MPPTRNMQRAAKDLQRRYREERRDLRQDGNYELLQCIVKLDRLVLTAIALSLPALCAIPGYRAKPARRLWKKLYSVVDQILGTGSIHASRRNCAPRKVGHVPK